MSGYKRFGVISVGNIGKHIVDELLRLKSAGEISSVIVITRAVSGRVYRVFQYANVDSRK